MCSQGWPAWLTLCLRSVQSVLCPHKVLFPTTVPGKLLSILWLCIYSVYIWLICFFLVLLTSFPPNSCEQAKGWNKKRQAVGKETTVEQKKSFGNKVINQLSCSSPQIPVNSFPVHISHGPTPLFTKMPFIHKKLLDFTFKFLLLHFTFCCEMFCISLKIHRNIN